MLREIRTHETDDLNKALSILVVDDPDPVSGASHCYSIAIPGRQSMMVHFQHGNPSVEINGITNEALFSVMADRLKAFQAGPFACSENADILTHIDGALSACQARARRVAAEQN